MLAAVALVNSAEEPDTLTTVEELAGFLDEHEFTGDAARRRRRAGRGPRAPPAAARADDARPRHGRGARQRPARRGARPPPARPARRSRLAHPRGRAGRPTRDPDGGRGGDGDDRRDPRPTRCRDSTSVPTRTARASSWTSRATGRGGSAAPPAPTAPRSPPTAPGSAETVRIAVVGASGKTGRAISASLASRGAAVVPVGRREWPTLADSFAGCDAVSIVAPNLHPDEPALVGEVLAAAESAGVARVVYHSVAAPYAPAMPHHLGKARAEDVVRRSPSRGRSSSPVPTCRTSSPRCGRARRTSRCPTTWTGRSDWSTSTTSPRRQRGCCWTTAMRARRTSWAGRTWSRSPTSPWRRAPCSGGRSWPGGRIRRPGRSGPGAGLQPREREWLAAMFGYYDRHGLPAGGRVLRDLLGGRSTPLAETLTRELTGCD